jgi:hypothetical protein
MILYSMMAALIWMVFRTFSAEGRRISMAGRAATGLAVIVLLGVAIGAVQLLPGYNFSSYSTRGEDLSLDQAESYSMPPEESLTMIFPHLFGYRHGFPDSSVSGVPVYFGRLGLRLSSEFTGVLVLLMAVAAFAGARTRFRWPLLAIGLTGLLISWGGYTPVFGLLYRILPILRKLRAPHMAAFLTTSAVALASGAGFDALFRSRNIGGKGFTRSILIFSGICLVVFLLAGSVLPGLQSSWWERMGVPDASGYGLVVNRRVDMASTDFLKAAIAALILAGLLRFRDRWKENLAVPGAVLTVFLALETIPVDRDFQYFLRETEVEGLFPRDEGLDSLIEGGRLLPGGNEYVPLQIPSVAGYHAAKPAVSQDLQSLISTGGVAAYRHTAFTVIQTQQGFMDYSEFRRQILAQASSSDPAYADTLSAILPHDPLPRTWFAESWTLLSANSCMRLLMGGLDPQRVTVLYEDPGLPDSMDLSRAVAGITVDEPERVVIETDNPSEGLLVLADTWYPRWEVYVDGQPDEIYQANHWQRAVALPAGRHTVEFMFNSKDVGTGLLITIAGFLSMLIILTVDLLGSVKRKRGS